MLDTKGVGNNEYLEYKGRPLVRHEDELFYGDMSDKFYIYMMIMSEKDTENGSVPDMIMVQLCEGATKSPKSQTVAHGFKEAFEYADAWLDRFNK